MWDHLFLPWGRVVREGDNPYTPVFRDFWRHEYVIVIPNEWLLVLFGINRNKWLVRILEHQNHKNRKFYSENLGRGGNHFTSKLALLLIYLYFHYYCFHYYNQNRCYHFLQYFHSKYNCCLKRGFNGLLLLLFGYSITLVSCVHFEMVSCLVIGKVGHVCITNRINEYVEKYQYASGFLLWICEHWA